MMSSPSNQELAVQYHIYLRIKQPHPTSSPLHITQQDSLRLSVPSQDSEYLKEPWGHGAYGHAFSWGHVS